MTKQELKEKHGTPEEFAEAAWKACDEGYLNPEAAKVAVFNYWVEWEAAD